MLWNSGVRKVSKLLSCRCYFLHSEYTCLLCSLFDNLLRFLQKNPVQMSIFTLQTALPEKTWSPLPSNWGITLWYCYIPTAISSWHFQFKFCTKVNRQMLKRGGQGCKIIISPNDNYQNFKVKINYLRNIFAL